jgi:hypothetical protein
MNGRVVRVSGLGRVSNNGWVGHGLAVLNSGRGWLFAAVGTNASGAEAYLQVFDKDGAVSAGDKPVMSVQVPAGQTGSLDWSAGRPFNRGLHVAFSTNASAYAAPAGSGFLIDVCYEAY